MNTQYDAGQEFDDIATEYDDGLKELVGGWGNDIEKFAEYKVQVLKMLVPLLRANVEILDFGCGTGRSLQYFGKYFPSAHLWGCDVSQNSLAIAKKRVPEGKFFLNSEVNDLYTQTAWDIVFLACVMHHIEPSERGGWIKAIGDNMKDGSFLAIFEHNLANPMTRRVVTSPLNPVDRLEWMVSPMELVASVTNACPKLSVYWKGYTLFSPWRCAGLVKVEKCLCWLPLGAQHCVIFKKEARGIR